MNFAKSPAKAIFQDIITTQQSLHSQRIAQDPMTIHENLYRQLMDLKFDDTFRTRLLRETGWSLSQYDRTIKEYRRFLFLHRTAGHTIVPSKAVDKVWHMHLLYTRSYWEDLCDTILQTPLHHHPGSATGEHRQHFWDNYEATLKSYETIFYQAPPADIWPTPALQFSNPKPITRWPTLKLRLPKVTLPKVTLPKVTLPKVTLPQVTLPKVTLPKVTLPRIPTWVQYFAIVLLTTTIAITQRAHIPTDFLSILKYGLVILSIANFLLFIPTTRRIILEADRLFQNPLQINPKTRQDADLEKKAMDNLGKASIGPTLSMMLSCLATVTAAYIQACQNTNSLFPFSTDHHWLISLAIIFGVPSLAMMIGVMLSESISNQILQKLKRQGKVKLDYQTVPSDWKTDTYSRRTRICQDCKTPVEQLNLRNLEPFLSEKERFAKKLNSIDITYSRDHCNHCSPAPARDNLSFRIVAKNGYSRCHKCETIARKTTTKVLEAATTSHEGKELTIKHCAYCQDHSEHTRIIPKIVEQSCHGDSCSSICD